jgi:4-diphosphocytidyl-2-C-methyl-D-erythritol kinase
MFFEERFTTAAGEDGLRLRCPAKVNLYLKVLARRPDGYHELVTVMQPLSLADELTVVVGGGDLLVECDHPELPRDASNLVWRAAQIFAQETGRERGAQITLRKRIPVAAGLGGGSSDAAGALWALNVLAGNPLNSDRLQQLAGRLGADVPFFLTGGPAVGRGIGTRLTPIAMPAYWYVLLNPGAPLATRWVYENLDLAQVTGIPAKEAWDPEHPESWVHNDLQSVAVRRFPELKELLRRLQELGARAQAVSGSGPTIFGLFGHLKAAQNAAQEMRRTFSGWMSLCRGLTGQEGDTLGENQTWMT